MIEHPCFSGFKPHETVGDYPQEKKGIIWKAKRWLLYGGFVVEPGVCHNDLKRCPKQMGESRNHHPRDKRYRRPSLGARFFPCNGWCYGGSLWLASLNKTSPHRWAFHIQCSLHRIIGAQGMFGEIPPGGWVPASLGRRSVG